MEQIVSSFLTTLGIPISEKYVQKVLSAHPDFPSLVSISNTLQRFGVQNIARRVDIVDLNELPYPYLLPLNKSSWGILLLKLIKTGKMKTEKMIFKNIKDVLSRDEMKKIVAGSGGAGNPYYCAKLNLCLNNANNLCAATSNYSLCYGPAEMQCYASWGAACMYGA